jgi:hypothetical protein
MYYIFPFGYAGEDHDRKNKRKKRMSVGAVGGGGGGAAAVGGVSGAGGASAAGAASAPTPASGAGAADGELGNKIGSASGDTDAAEKGGNITNPNMSTQDQISLQNSSQSQAVHPMGECQKGEEMDMKKLLEMMIILQLLEKMNEA